jgi:hypothetical protein
VWASKEGRATEWVRGCRSVQEQCRQSRGGQHVLIDSAPRAKRRAVRQTGSGFLLGSCSQMSRNLLPISLSPLFAGPKYRKPKMASHDLRAWSFEDGCLCSILHGPPSYFLLASSLLWHANRPHNFLTQPSLSHLSPPKDHLLPARFRSHFQPVSRLYIAVLPLWPSSLPPQAGCRRYNPSNAALPSTVRLLPGAHAKKVYAERA